MKRKTTACMFLAASFVFAPSADASANAKRDPTIDGLWTGSEIEQPGSVAIRIDSEHETMVFVDEYFVYFGKLEAKRQIGKKGSNVFQTKTTVTSIVDIGGTRISNAKLPAVTHARWVHKGDKLRMCTGAPCSKIVPKSAERPAAKVRCFELTRA
jgi:hypothetical protein